MLIHLANILGSHVIPFRKEKESEVVNWLLSAHYITTYKWIEHMSPLTTQDKITEYVT
jgi:hypothetical protein